MADPTPEDLANVERLAREKNKEKQLRRTRRLARAAEVGAYIAGQHDLAEGFGAVAEGTEAYDEGAGAGSAVRRGMSKAGGYGAKRVAAKKGLSAGKASAIGGGVQAALAGEGLKGIGQSAASAWVVNGAIISLLDPTLIWGSICLFYLNLHWLLSSFGFKWFRPMAIWQKAIVVVADILIILILVLIITVPLAVIYVGCNPEEAIGGVLGTVIAVASYVYMPSYICSAFEGAAAAVGTIINKGSELMCSTPKILAEQNNTPYPRQNDPDLQNLQDCIAAKVPNAGEISSYDKSKEICNYTRGGKVCTSSCSHSENSCHYGGRAGDTGSLAVDFGGAPEVGNEGVIGPQILQAALACSQQLGIPLKRNTCENTNGKDVPCSDPGANHTHTSIAKCKQDNGPINSR